MFVTKICIVLLQISQIFDCECEGLIRQTEINVENNLIDRNLLRNKRYALDHRKWSKKYLTWRFEHITRDDIPGKFF